jgi:hypothetical protein
MGWVPNRNRLLTAHFCLIYSIERTQIEVTARQVDARVLGTRSEETVDDNVAKGKQRRTQPTRVWLTVSLPSEFLSELGVVIR